MVPGIRVALFSLPLALSACDGNVPAKYRNPNAGFPEVAAQTFGINGKRTAFAQTQAQNEALSREVRAMVHRKTISAETAVQAALLNNKRLQVTYADVGLSAAEVWQQSVPVNPVFSLGLFGLGTPELALYRVLEATIAFNLIDVATRKTRTSLADAQFRQSQVLAVEETLRLSNETRRAWINSVSAFETLGLLQKAGENAEAAAELAEQLGRTGAFNKAGQAREFAFNAEIAGRIARAKLDAALAKEELTRLMGLWGTGAEYYVPNSLPTLPASLPPVSSIEAKALASRVDLRVAKIALEAQAKAFGLTNQTRLVNDLELIPGVEAERHRENGQTVTEASPQVEVEFTIPLFDSGNARMRKAELNYMKAAHALAERAVNVRSEARGAEIAYHATYEIARHYRTVVVPLRAQIEEEGLLSYNGMITNTFELLADAQARLGSQVAAAEAKRDFWLAKANVTAAIYGGGTSAPGSTQVMAFSDGGGGGH